MVKKRVRGGKEGERRTKSARRRAKQRDENQGPGRSLLTHQSLPHAQLITNTQNNNINAPVVVLLLLAPLDLWCCLRDTCQRILVALKGLGVVNVSQPAVDWFVVGGGVGDE